MSNNPYIRTQITAIIKSTSDFRSRHQIFRKFQKLFKNVDFFFMKKLIFLPRNYHFNTRYAPKNIPIVFLEPWRYFQIVIMSNLGAQKPTNTTLCSTSDFRSRHQIFRKFQKLFKNVDFLFMKKLIFLPRNYHFNTRYAPRNIPIVLLEPRRYFQVVIMSNWDVQKSFYGRFEKS